MKRQKNELTEEDVDQTADRKSQQATEVDQFAEFDANFGVVPTFRIYVEGKGESWSKYVTARNAFINSYDENILCCSRCNIQQPMGSFAKATPNAFGKCKKCKACQKKDRDDTEAKKRAQKYRDDHRDDANEYAQNYREDHKDEARNYRENHKDEAQEYQKEYQKNKYVSFFVIFSFVKQLTSIFLSFSSIRYQTNPLVKLTVCTRNRVNSAFTYHKKHIGTAPAQKNLGRWEDVTELLGCSVTKAWDHISEQFITGMSLQNHGCWSEENDFRHWQVNFVVNGRDIFF